MKLFVLLFLVACASHKETLKEQNEKAMQYNCTCDRLK